MNSKKISLAIAISLITFAVSLRLLPHPANFAPMAAVAIFGGAILPKRYAIGVPLAAMAISDLFIGFHSLIAVTWGSYAFIAVASSRWLSKPTLIRGASITLSSSIFFFIITNFAVWLTSGMYAHTWAGLVRCFEMALPFFRNTATSDLIYTGALFGAYALVIRLSVRFHNRLRVT